MGKPLAQIAITWMFRYLRVATALIGVRSAKELDAIDQFARETGIDLWRETSTP